MKLVRDNIPEIAPHRKFREAQDWELSQLVTDKILEEAQEVKEARNTEELTEELADLYQVMLKLAEINGIHWDDVLTAAKVKNAEKGGFERNIVML